MDISQISLALVADQYVEHIEKSDRISAEELSDFLSVATRLLLLKSQLLVPKSKDDEEEESTLETQLKIYRQFLDATKILEEKIKHKRFSFHRYTRVIEIEPKFYPPENLDSLQLVEMFKSIIKKKKF